MAYDIGEATRTGIEGIPVSAEDRHKLLVSVDEQLNKEAPGATVMLKHLAFGSTKPLDYAEQKGTTFAEKMGCTGNEAAACLRKLSTHQILKVQVPYLINQAIVDGVILPMTPADAFKSGAFNRVTLINGTTRDEGNFFAGFPENETGIAMNAQAYPTVFETFYGKTLAQQVLKKYPLNRYNTPSEGFAAAVTDSQFACPARAVNQWTEGKTPVFAYEFADRTEPSYLKATTFPLGAAIPLNWHTFSLVFMG
ncbi:carboxylesterase family protein [Pseudomonas cerasi]